MEQVLEFVSQPWVILVGVLVGALLGVFVGVKLIPKFRDEVQGYPYESEIERFLLPWALQAIQAAWKLADWSADELGAFLDGVDRGKLANSVYFLLPEAARAMISAEEFAKFVEKVYLWSVQLYTERRGYFDKEMQNWLLENQVKPAKTELF